MLPFAHLGIGSQLARPWSQGLPRRALLLGTLLPDLIDKPLYYGLVLITGKHAAELGLISGTRTFGHTAVFLLLLSIVAILRRSKALAAICLGIATHLLLDNISDHFVTVPGGVGRSALLWPFTGWGFPIYPFHDYREHLGKLQVPFLAWGEAVGVALLGWDTWKNRHTSEIVHAIRKFRHHLRSQRQHRFKRLRQRFRP